MHAYPKGHWQRKTHPEQLETHAWVCRVTRVLSYVLPNETTRIEEIGEMRVVRISSMRVVVLSPWLA